MKFFIKILLLLSSTIVTAQPSHQSLFAIHYSISNFNSKPLYGGLGISFIKTANRQLDYQLTLNGTYADSVMQRKLTSNGKNLLLQANMLLRARLFAKNTTFQPYAVTGIGFSKYLNHYGAFIPSGVGLQVTLFKDVYVLPDVQYRIPLTKTSTKHFFYSIGLAGIIGSKKQAYTYTKVQLPIKTSKTDRDNDGINDEEDDCPDEPGIAVFNGCADSDNDGIPDKNDKCPLIPGIQKYQGCPIPDSDNDGINDEEDKCPTIPGVAKYYGCPPPDTDHDGVNDDDDKCIDVPGMKENGGCPVITKETKDIIDSAARHIFFKTGSAELMQASFASLIKVIKILKEHPDYKLRIDGHTDNTGTPSFNELLSMRRAQAVMEYFVQNGIEAARLIAHGFGETVPIASNSSDIGRTKNRRVELHVFF